MSRPDGFWDKSGANLPHNLGMELTSGFYRGALMQLNFFATNKGLNDWF